MRLFDATLDLARFAQGIETHKISKVLMPGERFSCNSLGAELGKFTHGGTCWFLTGEAEGYFGEIDSASNSVVTLRDFCDKEFKAGDSVALTWFHYFDTQNLINAVNHVLYDYPIMDIYEFGSTYDPNSGEVRPGDGSGLPRDWEGARPASTGEDKDDPNPPGNEPPGQTNPTEPIGILDPVEMPDPEDPIEDPIDDGGEDKATNDVYYQHNRYEYQLPEEVTLDIRRVEIQRKNWFLPHPYTLPDSYAVCHYWHLKGRHLVIDPRWLYKWNGNIRVYYVRDHGMLLDPNDKISEQVDRTYLRKMANLWLWQHEIQMKHKDNPIAVDMYNQAKMDEEALSKKNVPESRLMPKDLTYFW